MDVVIKNQTDLKLEIHRLKADKLDQELHIKQHFNSPRAILGTIVSLFHKNKTGETTPSGQGFGALISKYLLPLTLDKTLFRKSGVMVKVLVRMLSQKASGLVSDENFSSFWDKLKNLIPHKLTDKVSQKKEKRFLKRLAGKQQPPN